MFRGNINFSCEVSLDQILVQSPWTSTSTLGIQWLTQYCIQNAFWYSVLQRVLFHALSSGDLDLREVMVKSNGKVQW